MERESTVSRVPDLARHYTIVLCGDVLPSRKLTRDSASRLGNVTLVHCSEEPEQLFSLCRRLNVAVFVAFQSFIEQLSSSDLMQLAYETGTFGLAILDGETVDWGRAGKMLRIGCRGVLPGRFSSTLFTRAVSAMMRGEFWAPRIVISALLSDLMKSSYLRSETGLTPQEARILELASQGYKNSAIAETLFISTETVRWHKRRLNRKLRAANTLPPAKATPPIRKIPAV
jgi:DNA-binding NarL/FixJ family response regulator